MRQEAEWTARADSCASEWPRWCELAIERFNRVWCSESVRTRSSVCVSGWAVAGNSLRSPGACDEVRRNREWCRCVCTALKKQSLRSCWTMISMRRIAAAEERPKLGWRLRSGNLLRMVSIEKEKRKTRTMTIARIEVKSRISFP